MKVRPPSTRRDQLTVLFFGLLVVYLLTGSYRSQSIDTGTSFFAAWQLAQHGNLTMDAFSSYGLWLAQVGDRLVPARFPGATWLATPLYLLGGADGPSPGLSVLTAAAASAGAVVLLVLLLARLVPYRVAVGGGLVLGLATPTWTVSADALWTHGPGQLWLLAALLAATSGRAAVSGLACAAAAVTRPHYAFVTTALAVGALRRGEPRTAAGLLAGTGAGVALLVLYNAAVFEEWGVRTGYPREAAGLAGVGPVDFVVNVVGTLVSPSRGVLVLTPFLLLLLPGLPAAWRAAPWWVRSAAVGGTLYLLVSLWMVRFSGGYAFFSYRLPLEWLTACAPLLVLAHQRWTVQRRWRRNAFGVLLAWSGVTHALGAARYRPETVEPDYWTTWPPLVLAQQEPVLTACTVATVVLAAAVVTIARRRTRWEPVPLC